VRALKYSSLVIVALLLFLLVDHVLYIRDAERLAEALGGDARQYLRRNTFPALFNPDDFPQNYLQNQFRAGVTTKEEVEQMVKGYSKKREFKLQSGVDLEYYFKVGLIGEKGILLGFDERNIYREMDIP
jgi:hypothetical protein